MSASPAPRPGLLARLNPVTRVREFPRTCRQAATLARVGLSAFRLAEQVIVTGQCLQRKWELLDVMGRVKRLRPAVVVEIGTYKGGTLRCWADAAPPSATLVSIDLPGGSFGGGSTAAEAAGFEAYLKPGQTLHTLRADSHVPATKAEVVRLLAGRPIDFLFIDGDHTYAGVKADYDRYAGLVRPGGLVCLHDIVPHPHNPACRVHEFWAELKAAGPAREVIDRDGYHTWGGIGVVTR